ncbi:helix-turn-helix domain-containing protein [Streptomonospora nanhaiensis]
MPVRIAGVFHVLSIQLPPTAGPPIPLTGALFFYSAVTGGALVVKLNAMANLPRTARRRLGADVRRWRENAGMTQEELGGCIPLSQSQVSAIEVGTKGTTKEQIKRIDDALTAGGALVRRWDDLQRPSGYAEWFIDVVSIEQEATEIREYQPLVIPGLLQTNDYARASLRQGAISEAALEEATRARLDRQEILDGAMAPALMVVLEEHVLRRPLGGRSVLHDQLAHLVRMAGHPKVTILAVPAETEVHPAQEGAFMLFDVPGRGVVSYTETRVSGTPSDLAEHVASHERAWRELSAIALPPVASRQLIAEIMEGLQHAD